MLKGAFVVTVILKDGTHKTFKHVSYFSTIYEDASSIYILQRYKKHTEETRFKTNEVKHWTARVVYGK